jgi:hypothetical protein
MATKTIHLLEEECFTTDEIKVLTELLETMCNNESLNKAIELRLEIAKQDPKYQEIRQDEFGEKLTDVAIEMMRTKITQEFKDRRLHFLSLRRKFLLLKSQLL